MNICGKCFNEFAAGTVCPRCGYDIAADEGKYPHALKPGSVLGGRYIVGRVLGQGGFGITYAAQDYDSKRMVAIKEYMPEQYATRIDRTRVGVYSAQHENDFLYGKENFLAEAKTLSQFNGIENICDIYSYFEENGTAYFAMEYVEGIGLDKYMRENGRLSYEEAENLLVPVMQALSRVHEKGIIHRDISPDNIMLRKDGRAMLIDFGAARYSMGEKSRSLDVILKHGFAPKEQYTRRGRQGAFTDVYAMAATFYYAITGKVPPEAIDRMDEDDLVEPSTLGVKLSHKCEDALIKALSVSAPERYQTMGEFAAALIAGHAPREVIRPPQLEKPPAVNPAPVGQNQINLTKDPPKKSKKKKPFALIAAAIVALLAVVLVFGFGNVPLGSGEIKWDVDSDGTLTITGRGAMEDYKTIMDTPWYSRAANVKNIVISEGITHVGSRAFNNFGALESVTIPGSVKSIGTYAFNNCTKLHTITYGANEKHWKNIEIADKNESLRRVAAAWSGEDVAVHQYKDVTANQYEDVTKSVDSGEAKGIAWNLSSNGTLYIKGSGAMPDFGAPSNMPWYIKAPEVKAVVISEGITHICSGAFSGFGVMESVKISGSVESIGRYAFYNCGKLDNVIYSGSEKQWDNIEIAQNNDSLMQAAVTWDDSRQLVHTPEIVDKGEAKALSWELSSDGTLYIRGSGAMPEYTAPSNMPWYIKAPEVKAVVISEGITHICSGAFSGFAVMESVTIPESVKSIGRYAFYNCRKLDDVIYSGSEKQWNDIVIEQNNDSLIAALS